MISYLKHAMAMPDSSLLRHLGSHRIPPFAFLAFSSLLRCSPSPSSPPWPSWPPMGPHHGPHGPGEQHFSPSVSPRTPDSRLIKRRQTMSDAAIAAANLSSRSSRCLAQHFSATWSNPGRPLAWQKVQTLLLPLPIFFHRSFSDSGSLSAAAAKAESPLLAVLAGKRSRSLLMSVYVTDGFVVRFSTTLSRGEGREVRKNTPFA